MHIASSIKFPFFVKSRLCLSQDKTKLRYFGFLEIQRRKYDPHQIISKRRHMNKNAPYDHDHVEGFDKLDNLEVCIDVEEPLQQVQID